MVASTLDDMLTGTVVSSVTRDCGSNVPIYIVGVKQSLVQTHNIEGQQTVTSERTSCFV